MSRDILLETPMSLAKHLAAYITDASTIRAHVVNNFGRAPSLSDIKKMQALARKPKRGRNVGDAVASISFKVASGPPPPPPMPKPRASAVPTTVRDCVDQVADVFGLTYAELVECQTRLPLHVRARQMAAQLLYARMSARTLPSMTQIGRWLGGMDHTSIRHSLDKFNEYRLRNDDIAREMIATYREFLEDWGFVDVVYETKARPHLRRSIDPAASAIPG